MANLLAKADLIDSSKSAAAMKVLFGDLHDFLEGHLGALEDLTITPVAPTDNTAKVLELLSGLAYQIQQITGKTNWYDVPTPMSSFMSGQKNKLINAIPLYMQRGTSVVIAAGNSAYAWDRWYITNGTNQSITCTLAAYSSWAKSFRIAPTGTAPTTGNVTVQQKIEGASTLSPQDRRCDGNATLYVEVGGYDPTASLVQFFGTGGSPSASVETALTLTKTSLGGTVNKFVGSVAVPSVAAKTPGTDVGTSYLSLKYVIPLRTDNCDILVNQLEPGTVNTPFESRHIAQELALCQRYYAIVRYYQALVATAASQLVSAQVYYPVTMRAVPTPVRTNSSNTNTTFNSFQGTFAGGASITFSSGGAGAVIIAETGTVDAEL